MKKKVLREKLDRNFELLKVQRDKELKQITSKYKNRKTELNGIHKKQRNINENDNLLRSQNLNVVNNKGNKSIITLDSKIIILKGKIMGITIILWKIIIIKMQIMKMKLIIMKRIFLLWEIMMIISFFIILLIFLF